jgi:hypothetical protein
MPVRRDSNHRPDLMYDRLISRGSAARAPGFCVLRGGQNMLSFRHSPFLASNLLSSNRCLKWRRCGYSRRFPSYSPMVGDTSTNPADAEMKAVMEG